MVAGRHRTVTSQTEVRAAMAIEALYARAPWRCWFTQNARVSRISGGKLSSMPDAMDASAIARAGRNCEIPNYLFDLPIRELPNREPDDRSD